MNKFSFLSCVFLLTFIKLMGQQRADTIKCYVQIMVPASGTVGMSKEIEDNQVFLNGGYIALHEGVCDKRHDRPLHEVLNAEAEGIKKYLDAG